MPCEGKVFNASHCKGIKFLQIFFCIVSDEGYVILFFWNDITCGETPSGPPTLRNAVAAVGTKSAAFSDLFTTIRAVWHLVISL